MSFLDRLLGRKEKLYQDAAWLRQKYWDEGLSLTEMAELAGCTDATVLSWMKQHDIPRRDLSTAMRMAMGRDEPHRDATWLHQKYWDEGLSLAEMAELAGCDKGTIQYWMIRHGIPRRDRSAEAMSKPYSDADWLRRKHWDEKLKRAPGGPNCKMYYVISLKHYSLPGILAAYGLHPRKSLVLPWPSPPARFLGHYVRGTFDGDGGVSRKYRGKRDLCAYFNSGSWEFLEGLQAALHVRGLSERQIYQGRGREHGYVLRYSARKDLVALYHLMYHDCRDLYMVRKYEKFHEYISR